ncbi:MAG: mannose-1-phosphate guanylyltransferase/mannose-6-phosphate isomerase [Gammaproteobacteria bacterium]|nr:MAG: mannose-1-phosphate guanylyltransferase/mannose-6-phosphate isomerase [Gammaproteobacteria bacterium]
MIIPVVLSGGSGTRLWPLSRQAYPKQFINLVDENSLLGNTVARLDHIEDVANVMIVCNDDHRFMVAGVLQSLNRLSGSSILLEPVGRNTAPAIALAAIQASKVDKDAILLIMPADHVIKEPVVFATAVEKAARAARSGKLVTFGIVPDQPHTGYGYIKSGKQDGDWSKVAEFVEKPDLKTAESYVNDGNYYWNSGMFVFRADRYLDELAKFCPEMITCAEAALERSQADLDFIRVDREAFEKSPADSIDYAVMEKTADAVVVPLDAGWSDVGSWSALWEIHNQDKQGNVCRGDVLVEDVTNSYIHSDSRLVAAIGIDNHVIVETGDVVLVADKGRVEEVKKLVEQVKAQDREEYRFHKKVHRPWGAYEGIAISDRFQVKRIRVKPGAQLSLQKHHHRSEHWIVVSGTAMVTRGNDEILLSEDQSTYIPLGVKHRLANPGVIPLEIIEVQTGAYLGEDDIVRFEDTYGRVK